MRRIIFILVIFAICSLLFDVCKAQVTQEWVAIYNSGQNSNDGINAMTLDTSSNAIVTGFITTTNQNRNFCTIKYNPSGVQQWVAIYNGPGSNSIDEAVAIACDKQGNIYVTGNSEQTGFLTDAYCTIKYNSSGAQQWVARYKNRPNGTDDPNAIAIDKFSNVYVTGASTDSLGYPSYLTIKYDSAGIFKWARYYYGLTEHGSESYSVGVDDSCNVYITGSRSGYLSGDCCTIKYNTDGIQQWIASYDGTSTYSNEGKKLVLDRWNNVYVTGITYANTYAGQIFIVKYDSQGIQKWLTVNNLNSSKPYGIAVDSNLNAIVTGWSYTTSEDYLTIKYNNNGVQQWVATYNSGFGISYDEAHDISIDLQNNVYITGISENSSQQNIFMTIKYDQAGIQKWQMSYPGGGSAIKVDKNFNVYVAGSSVLSGTKYTTIKYSQLLNISPISTKTPQKFELSQNYPNPFNSSTKIVFDIPIVGHRHEFYVRLIIYDLLGRETTALVNKQIKSGSYKIEWDASNYPSGVYFYKLYTEDFTVTKRMVLIK